MVSDEHETVLRCVLFLERECEQTYIILVFSKYAKLDGISFANKIGS